MAGPAREEPDFLAESICRDPYPLDFFQTLRRIQSCFPDKPRVGDAKRIRDEPFRLRQAVGLHFPPSTIAHAAINEVSETLDVSVHFPGLTGPNGPLPLVLTEFILQRKRDFKDHTLARFLDIFHHRILTLFYKAWALNNLAVDHERGAKSRFRRIFASFVGLGQEPLQDTDCLGEEAKIFYAGHLATLVRNAIGLRSILQDYFGIPVDVREFQGQWLSLPEDSRCYLGRDPSAGTVGTTCLVGSMVWECQLRFRIVLGPVTYLELCRLLPNGQAFARLRDWVRFHVGLHFSWDVQICIHGCEIPAMQLGENAYVGWTTWLTSQPIAEARDDVLIEGSIF